MPGSYYTWLSCFSSLLFKNYHLVDCLGLVLVAAGSTFSGTCFRMLLTTQKAEALSAKALLGQQSRSNSNPAGRDAFHLQESQTIHFLLRQLKCSINKQVPRECFLVILFNRTTRLFLHAKDTPTKFTNWTEGHLRTKFIYHSKQQEWN